MNRVKQAVPSFIGAGEWRALGHEPAAQLVSHGGTVMIGVSLDPHQAVKEILTLPGPEP
jgi:hypothetical protein